MEGFRGINHTLFLHYFELEAQEADDVLYRRLREVDVDHEGVVRSGVRRVDSDEVEVVDQFR